MEHVHDIAMERLWYRSDNARRILLPYFVSNNVTARQIVFPARIRLSVENDAIQGDTMPPTKRWRCEISSRHPPARGGEVIGMYSCNTDQFITIDITRIALKIKGNMRDRVIVDRLLLRRLPAKASHHP